MECHHLVTSRFAESFSARISPSRRVERVSKFKVFSRVHTERWKHPIERNSPVQWSHCGFRGAFTWFTVVGFLLIRVCVNLGHKSESMKPTTHFGCMQQIWCRSWCVYGRILWRLSPNSKRHILAGSICRSCVRKGPSSTLEGIPIRAPRDAL